MTGADPTGAIPPEGAKRLAAPKPPGDLRARLLALESPRAFDFDDPRQEWRRLFSEILGTFLLVLAGAGGAVVGAVSHGAISRTAAVTAPGLTVMAVILFMGAVGGAHLNPVVSVMFSLRGAGGDPGGRAAARGALGGDAEA